MTPRRCTVCHIRETSDYPFPSVVWDLCWNHGTVDRDETQDLHDTWLRLMVERYGHGGI